MNLLSSFTQPHSTPNLYAYDFLLWNIKEVGSVYIFFQWLPIFPTFFRISSVLFKGKKIIQVLNKWNESTDDDRIFIFG